MLLLLHFARFGPYHHARLHALAEVLRPEGWEVIGLETASTDSTYAWHESAPVNVPIGEGVVIRTVFPNRVYEELSSSECRRSLIPVLEELAPDAIAVAGWGTVDARITLRWCHEKGVKSIIMSETREADGRRVWWKEKLKSLVMHGVHGALVGGQSHRDYLIKLGIPAERIRFGYNVVDNAYFASEAARWRAVDSGCSVGGGPLAVSGGEAVRGKAVSPVPPYFLASNRFIERKNLVRLIEAYALFLQRHIGSTPPPTALCQPPTASPPNVPWNLVLLGDGPQRSTLIARCHELGLTVIESTPWEVGENPEMGKAEIGNLAQEDHFQPSTANCPPPTESPPTVYFPGFRQIEELPRFYAHAGAFIHPALEEPWGLVLNEAMACGLPVLSGDNVGAAAELIVEGKNGWTFDAWTITSIAGAMARMAALSEEERLAMGLASADILKERASTPAFGRGLAELLTIS